jgi:O-acetyl-ADP-ribose deacetylase (regulator of RNase III)
MTEIKYIIGDATYPQGEGKKIICHITNDLRYWNKGFVLALSKRWSEPEKVYRNMPDSQLMLGKVMIVPVENDIMVANMVAQKGVGNDSNGQPPIRYGALRAALAEVNDIAYRTGATLHMPKIGAGLAGGDWNIIEKIIEDVASVDVTVYTLN